MTNIIATIVIAMVTNVVEASNSCELHTYEVGIGTYGCLVLGCTDDHNLVAVGPATEKTTTTTVKQIETLSFIWRDKEWHAKSERVVSETVQKWRKNESWERVEDKQ